MLGLGSLHKSYKAYHCGHCLFGVCGHLRDIGKFCSISQSRLLLWKSSWKKLWPSEQVGCGRVSGDHQDMENGVIKVNGDLRFCALLCQICWVGGEFTKEQWHLPALLSLDRVAPTPTRKLVNSVPPHMSLAFFKLLLLHWSLHWVSS